jgi:hypothetical protein
MVGPATGPRECADVWSAASILDGSRFLSGFPTDSPCQLGRADTVGTRRDSVARSEPLHRRGGRQCRLDLSGRKPQSLFKRPASHGSCGSRFCTFSCSGPACSCSTGTSETQYLSEQTRSLVDEAEIARLSEQILELTRGFVEKGRRGHRPEYCKNVRCGHWIGHSGRETTGEMLSCCWGCISWASMSASGIDRTPLLNCRAAAKGRFQTS